jgi:TRAP-type C4-dicarboxylate transport system permease small subunit
MSRWMEIGAGITLMLVMLLMVSDIIGRIFGCPVPGAYEIASLAGGLIIGLAMPATSKAKGHVSTDILLTKLAGKHQRVFIVLTRFISIAVFLLAGYGMIMMGVRLKTAGEVTAILALPFYYVAYAIGGAFFVQALVLFSEICETIIPEIPSRKS